MRKFRDLIWPCLCIVLAVFCVCGLTANTASAQCPASLGYSYSYSAPYSAGSTSNGTVFLGYDANGIPIEAPAPLPAYGATFAPVPTFFPTASFFDPRFGSRFEFDPRFGGSVNLGVHEFLGRDGRIHRAGFFRH